MKTDNLIFYIIPLTLILFAVGVIVSSIIAGTADVTAIQESLR